MNECRSVPEKIDCPDGCEYDDEHIHWRCAEGCVHLDDAEVESFKRRVDSVLGGLTRKVWYESAGKALIELFDRCDETNDDVRITMLARLKPPTMYEVTVHKMNNKEDE